MMLQGKNKKYYCIVALQADKTHQKGKIKFLEFKLTRDQDGLNNRDIEFFKCTFLMLLHYS